MKVLLMVVLINSSVMLIEPLLTIYVLQLGGSHDSASFSSGIIFSAVGIATVLAAPRWGKLGGRIGFRRTLLIGLIGGGVGNLLQIFVHNLYGFGALRFGYGLFFAAVFPALNALIVQATSPEFRGRAFSLNQSSNQIGIMIGPMAGGTLGSWLSIPFVFAVNGIALLLVAFGLGRGKKIGAKSAVQEAK
jgi:MFS family permease